MIKADSKAKKQIKPFFEKMDDTLLRSYFEGNMGEAWVDDLSKPTAAQVTVSIFTFYAGDYDSPAAEELIRNLPDDVLIIAEADGWKKKLESVHAGVFDKFSRYRFYQNSQNFNFQHLRKLVDNLPTEFRLQKIDKEVIEMPSLHALSEDFTGNFASAEDYLNRGLGYVVIHNDKVVSGASSFSVYDEGIELEVGTHFEYRRKGLAAVASAALILDCLDKQKYPKWDAANSESLKLADYLGYVMKEAYDTYYVTTRKRNNNNTVN